MSISALNIHSIYEGIGRYSELIAEVIEEKNIVSFIPDKRKQNLVYRGHVVKGFFPPVTNGWLLNLKAANLKLKKYFKPYNFLHYLSPIIWMDKPGIVTIHDLTYLGNFKNSYVKKEIIKNLDNFIETKNVLTVSNQSRKSLLEYGARNVKLIDLCALPVFKPIYERKTELRKKYNIPTEKTVILTVGHGDTDLVHLAIKRLGYVHVHVGSEKADMNFQRITNEELNEIYNCSDLFVRITYFEGFGSPPMEAMTVGVPIVLSNLEVYKDIYQNSAIYSEADINSLVSSIKEALNSRKELLTNFSKKRDYFSFTRFKKEMLAYYEKSGIQTAKSD